jgi:hypothetical protein
MHRKIKSSIFLVAYFSAITAYAVDGVNTILAGRMGTAKQTVSDNISPNLQAIENELQKMADIFNKKLPKTIDQDTRLDYVSAGPGARVTYNNTLTGYTSGELNNTQVMQSMQKILKNGLCSNVEMQVFFKHGVTIRYAYQTSDGVFTAPIDITPKDCGYPK